MAFLLILGVALFYAMARGYIHGVRSVKERYQNGKEESSARRQARKELTHDVVESGLMAKGTRKSAAAVGASIGATVTGTRVHLHAIRKGWREGWREGREKARTRLAKGKDFVPEVTAKTAREVPSGIDVKETWRWCEAIVTITSASGIKQYPCGKKYQVIADSQGNLPIDCGAHWRHLPTPKSEFAPMLRLRGFGPIPTPERIAPVITALPTKEEPVSDTATTEAPTTPTPAPAQAPTGEVTSMSQLLAELERIQKEATAELDDAKGDASRATSDLEDATADLAMAKQEASAIEVMVGCLSKPELKLDADSIGEVSALTDGSQQRVKLAADRASAADVRLNLANSRAQVADLRLAAATKAHDGIKARHDVHREAHMASPVAAAGAGFYE